MAQLDKKFYKKKSWGSLPIKDAKDLPTLKLHYLMQMLKGRKDKHASLLEVGSGSGRILASIRARDKNIALTGIDLSQEQTKVAKQANKGRKINFVCGNGEELPFADNTFDYVVFLDYLEHINKPQQSLNEMRRVLKKGGILYFVCPAEARGIYRVSTKIFGRHFKEQTAGHIQQYTFDDLDRMVKKAKLTIADHKYSYHLLGSVMDYTMFTLLLNKKVAEKFWTQNQYYATQKNQKKSLFNRMLGLGNAIAYYESSAMKNKKIFATAVHITARKE